LQLALIPDHDNKAANMMKTTNFAGRLRTADPLRAIGTIAFACLLTACGQQSEAPAAGEANTEATTEVTAQAASPTSSDAIVGMRVDDFQLNDHTGTAQRLYYYHKAPAIVLMVQGNGCPIVRTSMPSMQRVSEKYAAQGVKFFLLNSNIQDNQKSISAEVAEFGYTLPVLVDEHQLIGESLKVTRTAEVFVINPASRKVVYHGPIDDRVGYENQRESASHEYLIDALDNVLAGENVAVSSADAPGCLVNFPERSMKDKHAAISYHDTIAPMLEDKCVGCHQAGGIGPWAMTSYDMVKGFAPMIREVIRTDRMPPWHADPNVGHFIRDKSLSSNEIKTLVHWIEAGAPRGDGDDPLDIKREPKPKWPLGEPDLIVDITPFTVPATGVVDYQYPVVPWPLKEGKWLKDSTVLVGSRETVHHVLTGLLKEMPADGDGLKAQSKWGSQVAGYAVGAESLIARDDMGTYIPPGGAIGLQMHYTTFGKEVTDKTQIGLYFYDDVPTLMMRSSVVIDVSIEIPAETASHSEVAYLSFPQDAELYYAFPHAHYRGQSSSLTLRYPDGREELLLSLPRYDFNWQRSYEFADPIDIPAGSKLVARYTYDNSAANPANPAPKEIVSWGQQSHEEMLFTAISYRWKDETTADVKPEYETQLHSARVFGMMDDNLNDLLEKAELKGGIGQRLAANFDKLDRNKDGALSRKEYAVVEMAQN